MQILQSFLIIGLIFLLLYFKEPLTVGEVYEKEYKPAYTKAVSTQVEVTDDKVTTTMSVPYVYSYPDRWIVRIKSDKKVDRKRTVEFYVTEKTFNETKIGQHFEFDEDLESKEKPYIRKKAKEQ